MVPSVGAARPAISRSRVDLPQPDAPRRLTNSPGMIFRSTPVKAVVPVANVFEIPASVSSARRGAPGNGLTIGVDGDIALMGIAAVTSRDLPPGARSFAF